MIPLCLRGWGRVPGQILRLVIECRSEDASVYCLFYDLGHGTVLHLKIAIVTCSSMILGLATIGWASTLLRSFRGL